MGTMNVHEAKSSFRQLMAKAERGETIVIARNGEPIAPVRCHATARWVRDTMYAIVTTAPLGCGRRLRLSEVPAR